jgi:ABC-type glycerol-3-phosphate transport system substrate-binding protein
MSTSRRSAVALALAGALGLAACGGAGSAATPAASAGALPQGSDEVRLDPAHFTVDITHH